MANGSRRGVLGLALLLPIGVSCQREALYPVVGPDGSRMVHVACEDPGRCYQIAGGLCPYGYDLWLAVGDDARNVLVRCRTPQPPAASYAMAPPPAAPAAAPAPPIVARTAPVSSTPSDAGEPWPPAAEPGAWPSANSGGTWPPQTEQATKRDASPPLDVGY